MRKIKVALLAPKESLFKTGHYYLNYRAQKNFNGASLYLRRGRRMTDEEIKYLSSRYIRFKEDLIAFPNNDIKPPLNKLLAFDCKKHLPEKYLMKADKATMANSVEERLPLQDKNVVAFAFKIPPKFKIRNGDEKHILKMAVKDLVF